MIADEVSLSMLQCAPIYSPSAAAPRGSAATALSHNVLVNVLFVTFASPAITLGN
jgi:hypothetical protein